MKHLSPAKGRVVTASLLWIFGLATSSDIFPVVLTLPTFAIAVYFLSKNRSDQFVLSDIFWVCILFFFVISPCQNINDLSFSQGTAKGVIYDVSHFLMAELIVLASVLSFTAATGHGVMCMPHRATWSGIDWRVASALLFISSASFALYLKFSGGLNNVLLPRLDKDRDSISFLSVLFLSFQTTCSTLLATGVSLARKSNPSSGAWFFLCFLVASLFLLISINPLNSARFFIVATWLPVALALTHGRLKYFHVYAIIVLGVTIAMPLMSVSTRGGIDALADFEATNYASSPLLLKDMDVFDTLVHATTLADEIPLGAGKFTLAIILFFVPRSIWIGKPVVAGLLVGEDLYVNHLATTSNLSFFFGGDFYLDFWFPGVIAGSLLLGICVRCIAKSRLFCISGSNLAVLFLIGSAPILIRGPMGAVVGYFAALMISCAILSVLFGLTGMAKQRK